MPVRRCHAGTTYGDVGTFAQYVSRLINKKAGIVNKIFVDVPDIPQTLIYPRTFIENSNV